MNEHIKDLRGLGGCKMLTDYESTIETVCACVEDVSDDNGVGFETNLSLFLDGLECDVIALKSLKTHQD